MLTLYQFPISHYCEKVRWALEYKNLEYKKVNLLPGLHAKKAKKLSSKYALPILQHDYNIVSESSDIISYLDKTFPDKPLTPIDPELLRQSNQWESFADNELGADVRSLCYFTLLDHPDLISPFFTNDGPWYGKLYIKVSYPKLAQTMRKLMKLDKTAIVAVKQRLAQNIDKVHAHINDREFFVGDHFSRADIAVASLLAPLSKTKNYGIDWPENYPEPLQSSIGEFGNKLDWTHRIYSQYR